MYGLLTCFVLLQQPAPPPKIVEKPAATAACPNCPQETRSSYSYSYTERGGVFQGRFRERRFHLFHRHRGGC